MAIVVTYLAIGSTLLAFLITWQAKTVNPDLFSIAKYNLLVLPAIYIANTLLGTGITKGHDLMGNMPLLIAIQSFFYNLLILLFSVVILKDDISVFKAFFAFFLITVGIYILKS
ncbi:MAG: putative rane protein [Peptococcaceae bacterium]|jgi:hypothetical protein|nr:putative rane protein [Peptococcaceae bacterium]